MSEQATERPKLSQRFVAHLNGGSTFSEMQYAIDADGAPTGITLRKRTSGRPEYVITEHQLHFGEETLDLMVPEHEDPIEWIHARIGKQPVGKGPVERSADDYAALLAAADAAKADRAERWPDATAALRAMFDAYTRLRELGWRPAHSAPKDSSPLQLIELASTGIHAGYRDEIGFWVEDEEDTWPATPVLYLPGTDSPESGKLEASDQ